MLRIERCTVRYPRATKPALDGVSFELAEGERVALIGPNGAGKSTLLRELAFAAPPMPDGTPRCALVPAEDPVFLSIAARDYVMLGRTARLSAWHRPSAADTAAVERAIAAVGMREFANRRLDALSSGERRRLALALALATEAPVLLLDEPTAHLDPEARSAFYALLRQRTLVMVIHEHPLPTGFFTRVVQMADGRILKHEA